MRQEQPGRILNTYVQILVESGVRQATIEAVARRCGLSKAGLLHHFGSRAGLDAALLARLRELVERDVVTMRDAPGGAVHYYLATSLDSESELERMVVAATRLAHSGSTDAGAVLRWARDRWFDVMVAHLGHPLLARLAILAGDGVSYHNDISDEHGDRFISPDDLDAFTRLVEGRRDT